jgi:hypothetical protein
MSNSTSFTIDDHIYTTLNCMNCGETLLGRRDKKFCDDHCRSLYHNVTNAAQYNLVRKTHTILRKNRRVLWQAIGVFRDQNTIPIHWLTQRGFSFQHCTQRIDQKEDSPVIVCYDIAYQYQGHSVVQIFFWTTDSRAA